MKILCQRLMLLLVHLSVHVCNAFSFTPLTIAIRPRTVLASTAGQDDGGRKEEWTLKQNWALQDGIKKYTVGDTTFWTQMLISSPELGSFHEEELKQRYRHLRAIGNNATVTAGDSPSVLDQWSIDEECKLKGVLNGRTVWFTPVLFGSWDDLDKDAFAKPQTGGYVEARGGRVFELGQQATSHVLEESRLPKLPSLIPKGLVGTRFEDLDPKSVGLPSMAKPGMGTIARFLGTSVLSAAIALGVVGSTAPPVRYHGPPLVDTLVVVKNYDRGPSSAVSKQYVVRTRTSARAGDEPSISEKRARTEARFLGEQRLISKIQKQLKHDKADLQQLKQQEGGDYSALTSEARAKKEATILNEQRRIKNLSIRLENDRTALDTLIKQERDLL